MARSAVTLLALCVLLPVFAVSARHVHKPFVVTGFVYCDTCRAGYETEATHHISGARVKIECKDRETMQVKYQVEGLTDSTGTYNILVKGDHKDNICDAMLVSSPQANCAEQDQGRNVARVILTNNNGLVSNTRYANAMGFLRAEPMSECSQILEKYQEKDD